jgi:uncharacterized protein
MPTKKNKKIKNKSQNKTQKKREIIVTGKIARTPEEIARGLMFRKRLKKNEGMLFKMGAKRKYGFWMKNTYISLDIIFLSKNLKIIEYSENTTPLSLKRIKGIGENILEVKSGFIKKNNLKKGDKIKFKEI